MEWQDQDAPIILGDMEERTYTFDEAADFILTNFRKFSPKMADFAQVAFEKAGSKQKIVLANVLAAIAPACQKPKSHVFS